MPPDARLAQAATAALDEAAALVAAGEATVGIDRALAGLDPLKASVAPEAWRAFCRAHVHGHPAHALLLRDPYTRRAYTKPRGYAGDAVMLDYVYGCGAPPDLGDPVAAGVFAFTTGTTPAQAVRHRRSRLADTVDALADERGRPVHVLSVAAGHLREVESSAAAAAGQVGRYVALDQDAESLAEVAARYGRLGVEVAHGTVRSLIRGDLQFSGFDLVYAAGLLDYLDGPTAVALLRALRSSLGDGGRVLVANFAEGLALSTYMEAFMDWHLVYRSENDLYALAEAGGLVAPEVSVDPYGAVLYVTGRGEA